MIRIYLDWSVISSLKTPEFKEIKDYFDANKHVLLFPYSPPHFQDLMKSHKPGNKHFDIDLEMLEHLSGKHLINWDNDKKMVIPFFCTPKDYFKGESSKMGITELFDIERLLYDLDESFEDDKDIRPGKLLRQLLQLQPSGIDITEENREVLSKLFPNLGPNSTMWDFMKVFGPTMEKMLHDRDYYKDLRSTMADGGFRIDADSGNWAPDEVIEKIDKFLKEQGLEMTFLEYINATFKHKKDSANLYELYTTAYLTLDMFGYKKDNLPKPTDNMQNIQADGEHSFYGAHCDYFIALDKKLVAKSQALYSRFDIPTQVIEPGEVIKELKKVIDPLDKKTGFIEEALSFCKKDNLIEAYPSEHPDGVSNYAFLLPKFYFNYFNVVILTNFTDQEWVLLTFRKAFKNYSRFIFYTESDAVIDSVCEYFGYPDRNEQEDKKRHFNCDEEEVTFEWTFDGGAVILEKEEDTKRPILVYYLSTEKHYVDIHSFDIID